MTPKKIIHKKPEKRKILHLNFGVKPGKSDSQDNEKPEQRIQNAR